MIATWVVQTNLQNERSYSALVKALVEFNIHHHIVQVMPFTHHLVPEPVVRVNDAVIATGSTTLMKIADARKWIPGMYRTDLLTVKSCLNGYKDLMLNADAEIHRFVDVPRREHFFIRPNEDDKSFAGFCINQWDDFAEWRDGVVALERDSFSTITPDSMVAVSRQKEIVSEWRVFVVGDEVITGSGYKSRGRVVHNDFVPPAVMDFAQSAADIFSPCHVYAMDVAWTGSEYKIIEVNCGLASGFYDADVYALVKAIHNK